MKRVSTTLALIVGAFATFSSAGQVQGIITGYAPSSVQEHMTTSSSDSYKNLHSDFSWSIGGEYLISPAELAMVGGGIGFVSVQKDGGDNVVMPAIPLWVSAGIIGFEKWIVRPYFEARVGYAFPAATFSTWWSKPLNFMVSGNIGARLPYHMGVEFNCTYLSMNKKFKAEDVNFRLNSVKVGGSITVHFDLSKTGATEKSGATEPAAVDVSGVNALSETSENSESSYSDPYSSYGESSAEQSAAPVDDSYGSSYEATPAEEPAEEAAAEESAAEEASAEEEVAEAPAEEPVAEAPAPEAKPAAPATTKKATKKAAKKTTKKTTKKAAKKTTKKAAKKTTKKKK